MRFRSIIEIQNINPYVRVSARRAAQIQKHWRKPLPVRVRINGQPKEAWRINMMPAGDGDFYLYLHGDVRKASKTAVGDTVMVELEFDDEYKSGPAHPMPAEFRESLDRNRAASQAWDKLTPSLQKEMLRYLARLKSADARARNVQRAIHVLSGRKGRFLGRAWNSSGESRE